MVLCDGLTQSAAAAQAGIPRPNVTRQVTSARRIIQLAEQLTSR